VILLVAIIVVIAMLFGCTNNSSGTPQEDALSIILLNEEIPGVIMKDILQESSGEAREIHSLEDLNLVKYMTMSEALDMLGSPQVDDRDSDYPIVYHWILKNGECLYIVFESEERDEFLKELNAGSFILPNETPLYGDSGIRMATENEISMIRDFIRNHRAVEAYVVKNGERIILFD